MQFGVILTAFRQDPWFHPIHILIGDICGGHNFLYGFAKLPNLKMIGNGDVAAEKGILFTELAEYELIKPFPVSLRKWWQ